MLWTFVFIAIFVVLGVGVVLVAMRSGRRSPDAGPAGERRRSSTLAGAFAALVVVALAVPALVMVANADDQSKQAPGGIKLNDSQAEGRALFAYNCANCHTLKASNSVGRVGPNLDQMRPPKALVLNAIQEGRAQGKGQMPAQLLGGEQAEQVSDYVATVAGR